MRTLFSLFLLGTMSFSFAQLSVRNDQFIYVNDQVIYVTDDINLNETDSKIYLRDDSQLVQGNGVTGNSGVGELSAYQSGNVNQWSFNYWCSPVGGILVDNSLNNAFRINQLDDPQLATLSTIDSKNSAFTSEHEGNVTDSLTISNRWLYTYETADTYSAWNYVADVGDVSPGLGFTMKGIGTDTIGSQTYDFRGKPNNGTIPNAVVEDLFTLVGNPYPSAMDTALYIHDTDNADAIEGTLYFWEQDGNVASHVLQEYVGGYYEYTINAAGDLITETPAAFKTYDEQDNVDTLLVPRNGFKNIKRYLPIGQGFMVKGKTGTLGTVYAKNEFRVYEKPGAESVFFRGNTDEDIDKKSTTTHYVARQANGLSLVPSEYKRFRINVDFISNATAFTRQLVLNFHDSATAGYDRGLELTRAQNYATDAYFSFNEKVYSGQAFPFEETLTIPLNIDIEDQQPLRFRILDIQNFDENQGIYIHDIETDTYVNLRDQNYELNIAPGNYSNRFEIVFMPNQVLTTEDFDVNTITINQDNRIHQLSILNPKGLDVEKIEVFDVSGKKIYDQKYETALDVYRLSTSSFSDGVYIVNVLSQSSAIKSQKIIVKN